MGGAVKGGSISQPVRCPTIALLTVPKPLGRTAAAGSPLNRRPGANTAPSAVRPCRASPKATRLATSVTFGRISEHQSRIHGREGQRCRLPFPFVSRGVTTSPSTYLHAPGASASFWPDPCVLLGLAAISILSSAIPVDLRVIANGERALLSDLRVLLRGCRSSRGSPK